MYIYIYRFIYIYIYIYTKQIPIYIYIYVNTRMNTSTRNIILSLSLCLFSFYLRYTAARIYTFKHKPCYSPTKEFVKEHWGHVDWDLETLLCHQCSHGLLIQWKYTATGILNKTKQNPLLVPKNHFKSWLSSTRSILKKTLLLSAGFRNKTSMWQDLGARINQGDQAQEKLRSEKEALEATAASKSSNKMKNWMSL